MTARKDSAFLFDLDGTLVDSVYQHVIAWREALGEVGIALSVWRIHRRIGMSGGLFVNALLRETGVRDSARAGRSGCASSTRRPTCAATRPWSRCLAPRELLAALTSGRPVGDRDQRRIDRGPALALLGVRDDVPW